MKTIKDVLSYAQTQIKAYNANFICLEITYAPFNDELCERTLQHFRDNKPTKTLHKQFYDNNYYNKQIRKTEDVWWKVPQTYGDIFYKETNLIKHYKKERTKANEERIKFLQYLISKL